MSGGDEDYVYDEASGEWLSASDARDRVAAAAAGRFCREDVVARRSRWKTIAPSRLASRQNRLRLALQSY